MMIEIALATAVALNGPEPKGTWLDGNDVLTSELELGKPKYVWIRLLISPSGELQSCDIERSSGSARLDAHTCNLTRRRARFRPATWLNGAPAWSVYRFPINYIMADAPVAMPLPPADIELRVSRLPAKVRSPADAGIALAVDRTGKILSCVGFDNGQNKKQDHGLIATACKAAGLLKPAPARDTSGAPVDSVQTARVNFILEQTRK